MQKPLTDEELTVWRNECRELDAKIEQCLWKFGEMMSDGIASYGNPAKEFSKTFRTPPNITNLAVEVVKSARPLNAEGRITFAIARELSAIKDDQSRFRFFDDAVNASDQHLDPSEFRKMLRANLATSCQSPRAPRKQPVRLVRDLLKWLEDQPDEFWTPEMSLGWAKELQPLVDFFKRLNANRPGKPDETGTQAS